MIKLYTSFGVIGIEVDTEKAPVSAKNFLDYVAAGHYDNTIFHRVIPGFMVQGGGFAPGMKQKPCKAPIANEADNGLKNDDHQTMQIHGFKWHLTQRIRSHENDARHPEK